MVLMGFHYGFFYGFASRFAIGLRTWGECRLASSFMVSFAGFYVVFWSDLLSRPFSNALSRGVVF